MDYPETNDTSLSDRVRQQMIDQIRQSEDPAVVKLRPVLVAQLADGFPTSADNLVQALLATMEDSTDETS